MIDAAVMQKFSICLKTPVDVIFLINIKINTFVQIFVVTFSAELRRHIVQKLK